MFRPWAWLFDWLLIAVALVVMLLLLQYAYEERAKRMPPPNTQSLTQR